MIAATSGARASVDGLAKDDESRRRAVGLIAGGYVTRMTDVCP